MKEKVITALATILIMAAIGVGTYYAESARVIATSTEASRFHVNTSYSFSTISGYGTAVDLGELVCLHNITAYKSGTWLTTSVAPGLQLEISGSNDGTNYGAPFSTYWWTASGTAASLQISGNNCYRYIKGGWMSSAGAWAWTTPATGRVNLLISSGGA